MIELLSKWFLKDPQDRTAKGILCSVVGIGFNILLFAGKGIIGLISDSVAIMADAFNNLSDAGSSLITLLGFRIAQKKPDADHPFGHGRYEYISGLVVSFLIVLMGYELFMSSLDKVIHPETPSGSAVTIVILVASILVKLYMFLYNRRVGKQIDSSAMQATAKDSLGDAVATAVVLAATVLFMTTGLNLDGWCGMVVSLFIFFNGFMAAKDTIGPLLGEPPSDELVSEISEIVLEDDELLSIHDMVVHDYGPGNLMVSLHAEVDGSKDVFMLHDHIDQAEERLRNRLHCEAVIHLDPIETSDAAVGQMRMQVSKLLQTLDDRITIHDFRMVPGESHTNLIFDAVVPHDLYPNKESARLAIVDLIHEVIGPSYHSVITVDYSYVGNH